MRLALARLQLTRPPYTVIQIIGTNGKGSTATFLESIARSHGIRTGLFTSPHFISPHERLMLNGSFVPQDTWITLANTVYKVAPDLTYFEFLTVLALLTFAQCGVQCAIMEAGLGGRHDATSAVHRNLVCITPISMDHEHVLGHTLQDIARDKAMALTHNVTRTLPVLHAPQHDDVMDVLNNITAAHTMTLKPATAQYPLTPTTPLGLHGMQQYHNAALALAAWKCLAQYKAWPLEDERIRHGLQQAFIPGRMQDIFPHKTALPPHMLLDGAHNAHSLEVLHTNIQTLHTKPALIIFSCLADKVNETIIHLVRKIRALCHHCPILIPLMPHNERAVSAQERNSLLAYLRTECDTQEQYPVALNDMSHALTYAQQYILRTKAHGPVLICGSLYLLGEFFTLYPEYLTPQNQHTAITEI